MAELYWENIEIAGIAGAVPKQVIDNLNYSDFFYGKRGQSRSGAFSYDRFDLSIRGWDAVANTIA